MNIKLVVALSLMAGQTMAMGLAIDYERAIPTDITKKKVVLTIQNQEREIPARFIPLIGALVGFYVEGSPLQMSPMTLVSLDTWQLIENQLERVYAMNQGNQQVKNEIIANYGQLDTARFIDLIRVVDFLDISLLKEITLEIAQNKLTFEEVLGLPELVRNEVIKRKALKIAGPVRVKEVAACRGHDDRVWSVCVTQDGKIVSGSMDKTIRIWDMNGQQLAVCRGHEHWISSVCVTSDDKIVSGSWDKTVRIWNMNGQQLAVCRGHEGLVTSVCVTPDGKIVSGSTDKTIRIWDMNGQQRAVCRGHEGGIRGGTVCVTPDGKIVSGSDDKTIRIWDMNGQELAVCRGHEAMVWSVRVISDDKIVSGSRDKTVRIWDMNGQELAVCRGHEGNIDSVLVIPDGKIVSGSFDNTLRVWDKNGQKLAICRGHAAWKADYVFLGGVTANGKIISGSWDKTVRIWEVNGQELAVCRGHKGGVSSARVTSEGKIVSGSDDKTVRIWDISWLDLLSVMSTDQAQAICKLLQLATCENQRQKNQCWKKIAKILEKEELGNETKKRKELGNRKNSAGKRLRKLPKE